jgi:acetoacetyl-CoA synthetase
VHDVKPGVHLASISGGTDLISCFALGNPLLPVWRGELQCLGLGMAVEVLDSDGDPVRGEAGELVCTRPFPSMPVAFWNDPDGAKYRAAYFDVFPGVWRHGDWAEITAHDGSSSTAAATRRSIPAACASARRRSTGRWSSSPRSWRAS